MARSPCRRTSTRATGVDQCADPRSRRRIATNTDQGIDPTLEVDSPAGETAAEIIEKLAGSADVPADLSVSNEGTSGATFGGPQGAFMVNWTYIWTNYDASQPEVKDDIGYARYPQSTQGEESRLPYGGIGVGVSEYSRTRTRRCRRSSASPRREPGRERRAHRQHAGQRGRLRLPGTGQDLPPAAARAVPAESRRGGSAHGHAVLERHLRRTPELLAPDRTASTPRPRRTRRQFIEDVLHGRSLL